LKHEEDIIQMHIVQYLEIRKIFCASMPNEAAGKGTNKLQIIKRMARLKRMGLRPGAPDLLVFFPWNEWGFIEVKSKTGTLRKNQKEFRDMCKAKNTPWLLARSVSDVALFLEVHNV